jgi:predicted ArsR family transcriptional regulator
MMTSRQKVLTHLKKARSASAREIARALKMSPANVRHHLSVLCADGLVETAGIHNREGRGRPEKVYSLAQAALGDNLSALTDALLGVAGKKLDVEAVAERMLDAGQFAILPIPRRLAALVEALNGMRYQAHWEAGAEGPRILFGRCPYWKVMENHPEICKMDEALLKNAMAQPVSGLRKNESARGLCPFVFQIG